MFLLRGDGGIQAVIDAIVNIFDFFVMLFKFIGNTFKSMVLAFTMLLQMIPKVMTLIATLPSWLISFATITIGVTIAYFIIGRNAGKSE